MEDFNPSEEEPKAEVKQEDDDETDLVGPLLSCMLLSKIIETVIM